VPRIDAHTHFLPDGYRAALGALARLPDHSTDALLAMMDRFAIDAAVVSVSPPGVFHGDAGQARELARLVNEHAAALRRDHPGRFATLGVLPLPDVPASIGEVAHGLDELGLDGFELFSNVAGTYPDDPAWDPVLEALDARAAYVFVHPGPPPYARPLPHPDWLYEYPFESTRAIVNLVYSGAFERFPNVRWQFAHLGGTAPFLAHRIASLAVRAPERTGAGRRPRLPAPAVPGHRPGGQRRGPERRAHALARRPGRLRHRLAVRGAPRGRLRPPAGPGPPRRGRPGADRRAQRGRRAGAPAGRRPVSVSHDGRPRRPWT